MAFRSDDQDYRWPRPGRHPDQPPELARGESSESLSLYDTLRELAVTVAGFIGVIVLIVTAVKFLHG
jgi:hypothetical protein